MWSKCYLKEREHMIFYIYTYEKFEIILKFNSQLNQSSNY